MTHHMHQGIKEYLKILLDEHSWNRDQWAWLLNNGDNNDDDKVGHKC
jgi:hypothetical protein